MSTTQAARIESISHANAAYAGLPGPVTFSPPVSLAADVDMPSCPCCGDGTVFLFVCGRCGSKDAAPYCCQERMLVRGAYVSVLPGHHSWLGCALMSAGTAR